MSQVVVTARENAKRCPGVDEGRATSQQGSTANRRRSSRCRGQKPVKGGIGAILICADHFRKIGCTIDCGTNTQIGHGYVLRFVVATNDERHLGSVGFLFHFFESAPWRWSEFPAIYKNRCSEGAALSVKT